VQRLKEGEWSVLGLVILIAAWMIVIPLAQ
jgi:hypothetical protein